MVGQYFSTTDIGGAGPTVQGSKTKEGTGGGFLDSKLENQETGHKSRKLMLFSVLKVTVDF